MGKGQPRTTKRRKPVVGNSPSSLDGGPEVLEPFKVARYAGSPALVLASPVSLGLGPG